LCAAAVELTISISILFFGAERRRKCLNKKRIYELFYKFITAANDTIDIKDIPTNAQNFMYSLDFRAVQKAVVYTMSGSHTQVAIALGITRSAVQNLRRIHKHRESFFKKNKQ
jgi:hypothetical protein